MSSEQQLAKEIAQKTSGSNEDRDKVRTLLDQMLAKQQLGLLTLVQEVATEMADKIMDSREFKQLEAEMQKDIDDHILDLDKTRHGLQEEG